MARSRWIGGATGRGAASARQPALDMNSGTLVTDWTGGNLVPGGATTIVTPPLSILGPKALRLDANGATSPSQHDIDLSATPITEDAFTALAFTAHNPGTEPQVIRIYVSKTSNYSPNTSIAQTELALWPGTWTYAINREAFKRGDNLAVRFWGTAGDIIRIRIKELDSAANGYYPPSVNSSSLIGSIRMLAPASKGTFLPQTDDGRSVNFTRPNWAGGKSFVDMFSERGWRGTAYIVPTLIGTAGYMSWDQVLQLEDLGWTVAPHSDLHPVGPAGYGDWGLRMYRYYSAAAGTFDPVANPELDFETTVALIRADIERARDKLYAAGVRSGLDHLALPQGGLDDRVEEACKRAGYKTVRGVLLGANRFTVNLPVRGGASNRMAVMAGLMNTNTPHGPVINLPSSKSFEAHTWGDFAQTDSKLYIDEVARLGAVGSSYMHQIIDQTWQAGYETAFDYLRQLEQQGRMQVLPLHEWWGAR